MYVAQKNESVDILVFTEAFFNNLKLYSYCMVSLQKYVYIEIDTYIYTYIYANICMCIFVLL